MTDPIPQSAPAPAAPPPSAEAAPAPQAAPAPAATTPEGGGGAQAVHPSWDRALQGIPDAWQAPIRAEIANMEREHQKALEQARQGSVDPQWRALIEEAQQYNLGPDQFAEAYNGQEDMRARLLEDPDGFVSDITAFIDQQVAAGALTRKQGQEAKAQAQAAGAAAGADTDLFETPEAKQISELQQRLDAQDAARRAEEEQRQQQAAAQEAEQYANQFMTDLDAAYKAAGFRDPQTGADLLPPALQQQVAYVADAILDQNPQLTQRQAIDQAVASFQQATQQWQGGSQQPATQRAMPPVIGGGTMQPAAPNAQPPATPSDRNAAAVAAMKQLQGL